MENSINNHLFLFLTGSRHTYAEAVMDAMSSPAGQLQQFSYAIDRNVDVTFASLLAKEKEKRPILLIFADRYAANGYHYIPIRGGTCIKSEITSGRLLVKVELSTWPASADPMSFTNWVRTNLVPLNAPRLSGHIENDQDGYYVLEGPNSFGAIFGDPDGWKTTAQQLSQTRVFCTDDKQAAIFSRVSIKQHDGFDEVRASNGRTCLSRGSTYLVSIEYYFPLQGIDANARVGYTIERSSEIKAPIALAGTVGAKERVDQYEIGVDLFPSGKVAALQPVFATEYAQRKLLVSRASVKLRLVGSLKFWLLMAISAALWSGLGGFKEAWGCKCVELSNHIGPFLQFASAFVLLFILGKK